MSNIPQRFPKSGILSLTSEPVRYDLAESVGPDLNLGSLMGEDLDLNDLALSYGTAPGNGLLRQMIAARHDVPADQVVTMVGGMQTLFLAAFILCEPGDEAVIASPVFPNARSVLQSVGAVVKDLLFTFDEGYRLKEDRLRTVLTPKTKLISLATPQNPSGVAITEDEVRSVLSAMGEICPNAVLLLDETYREAVYGQNDVLKSLVTLDRRIVSCASLSKCHGAPGIRMGWAITQNEALREQFVLGKFNTVIANSLVDDALAIRVLEKQDAIVGERRRHLQAGLDKSIRFFKEHSDLIEWILPDAGALCVGRLRQSAFDEASVAQFYAEMPKVDLRVGPGSWFGEDDQVFRLGFGLLSMEDYEEGLNRLSRTLRSVAKIAA